MTLERPLGAKSIPLPLSVIADSKLKLFFPASLLPQLFGQRCASSRSCPINGSSPVSLCKTPRVGIPVGKCSLSTQVGNTFTFEGFRSRCMTARPMGARM